jgi:hypothetical protein
MGMRLGEPAGCCLRILFTAASCVFAGRDLIMNASI